MIKVSALINLFKRNKSNFYTGVPDSVLKELSSSLQKTGKKRVCHWNLANPGVFDVFCKNMKKAVI